MSDHRGAIGEHSQTDHGCSRACVTRSHAGSVGASRRSDRWSRLRAHRRGDGGGVHLGCTVRFRAEQTTSSGSDWPRARRSRSRSWGGSVPGALVARVTHGRAGGRVESMSRLGGTFPRDQPRCQPTPLSGHGQGSAVGGSELARGPSIPTGGAYPATGGSRSTKRALQSRSLRAVRAGRGRRWLRRWCAPETGRHAGVNTDRVRVSWSSVDGSTTWASTSWPRSPRASSAGRAGVGGRRDTPPTPLRSSSGYRRP